MHHIVEEFLNMPLDNGDAILEKFAALPGAIVGKGQQPLQRYVCIPGMRKDRVVLTAHADTVWDKSYKKPFTGDHTVLLEDGIFRSASEACGIGADCRAGCAMLWQLRNSGHTLLITDGEEFGKHGAKFLKNSNKKLFRELNRHRYMLAFDWKGTDCSLFNQVDNTRAFKKYIEQDLGFADSKAKGGCDLQILCRRVCGVNLGIGYDHWHTARETLDLAQWENTLHKVEAFLRHPQKRFPSLFFPPYIRLFKIFVNKILRILKLKK